MSNHLSFLAFFHPLEPNIFVFQTFNRAIFVLDYLICYNVFYMV